MKNRLRVRIDSSKHDRGAALILEIIIYLVMIALIAVTVTMGYRTISNLAFETHAKNDTREAQHWIEGRYALDNQYPDQVIPSSHEIQLTRSGGVQNTGVVKRSSSGGDWCLLIVSARIENPATNRFWVSSANVNEIIQSDTDAGGWSPASGVDDLQCPSSVA